MTTCHSPEAIASRARRFSAAVILPVTRPQEMPSGASVSTALAKCWLARISVGAISAPWPPALTHRYSAQKAISVLPQPTSPCTMRAIACGLRRSSAISPTTRRCAFVGGNGSVSKNSPIHASSTESGWASLRVPASPATPA